MVKLRFLLAWGAYAKGAIIEPPAMLRQQLLSTVFYGRRIVEEVKDDPSAKRKLRFLLAWGECRKGAVIEVPDAAADRLLGTVFYGRRVVEEIKDSENANETPDDDGTLAAGRKGRSGRKPAVRVS